MDSCHAYFCADVVAPLSGTASDLGIHSALLGAVFGVGLVSGAPFVAVLVFKLMILLVDLAKYLLAQAATARAEQASLTFLAAAKTTLLITAAGVGQPGITRVLLAVLFIVDEVPALREMRAEILDDWTRKTQSNIRPAHARAHSPVKLVVFPV